MKLKSESVLSCYATRHAALRVLSSPWLRMRDMTQSRESDDGRGEISRADVSAGRRPARLAAGAVFGSGRVGSVRASAAPNVTGWDGLSTALGGQGCCYRTARISGRPSRFSTTNYNGLTPAAIVNPPDIGGGRAKGGWHSAAAQ